MVSRVRNKKETMSILFEPMKIRHMDLRNRFVRSATYDGCANKSGYVTENQMDLHSALAEGGVGLIITGITYVHPTGQTSRFQNSIVGDEFIHGFKRLTAAVHRRGAKIAVQLFHAGREARFLDSRDRLPIGPSFFEKDPYFKAQYRTMTLDEIWEIVSAFGNGARRAREAGFDAVQIHAAHGYLLTQFLSPFTNRRHDEWGGNLENRVRIHHAIYEDIRGKVGKDYPVLIKIGVQDAYPGGLEFSESKLAAKYLAEWGFDALEISLGLRGPSYEETEFRTKVDRLDGEAYYRNWCRDIRKEVDIPIIMVGGLRTFELLEEIVQKKESDFISLSRPLIREPNIVNDWKRGDRHRAKCISCNKCLEGLRRGKKLHCFQEEKTPKSHFNRRDTNRV
jgi:2,4-dienoyl-CoA reductase-like NADH-dependent reductase (Old Yellow Enzyme family)